MTQTATKRKPGPQPRSKSGGALAPAVDGTAVKRSITVRSDLDRKAHQLVGDRGFSLLVNEGLELVLQARGFGKVIEEYEAVHGKITKRQMDDALRAGLVKGKRRNR